MTASKPSFLSAALEASGIHLRGALPEDLPLLAEIYATTRDEELQQVPWSAEQKRTFTDWQSAQQELHYALHYPHAARLVIDHEPSAGEPNAATAAIGRILRRDDQSGSAADGYHVTASSPEPGPGHPCNERTDALR